MIGPMTPDRCVQPDAVFDGADLRPDAVVRIRNGAVEGVYDRSHVLETAKVRRIEGVLTPDKRPRVAPVRGLK